MISFIIIGKNEGWKLTKCLESVVNFVRINSIDNFEIIYVDSKSSDDSIERAKTFLDVKIYQITCDCNAAIARNIGAKVSKGDILYFIDGDMEINSDFFKVAFSAKQELLNDFVSGQFINYNYNSNWKFENTAPYQNLTKDRVEYTTGGLFLIKRENWNLVNGMKNKFRRNQDLDFGLRLAQRGIFLIRKNEVMAIHHTIPYNNTKRQFQMLFDGSENYYSVLIRDHIFNRFFFKKMFLENYTLFILIALLFLVMMSNNYYIILIYPISLLIKAVRVNLKNNKKNIILSLVKFFFRDLIRIFGILLFFPKDSSIHYKRVS